MLDYHSQAWRTPWQTTRVASSLLFRQEGALLGQPGQLPFPTFPWFPDTYALSHLCPLLTGTCPSLACQGPAWVWPEL